MSLLVKTVVYRNEGNNVYDQYENNLLKIKPEECFHHPLN